MSVLWRAWACAGGRPGNCTQGGPRGRGECRWAGLAAGSGRVLGKGGGVPLRRGQQREAQAHLAGGARAGAARQGGRAGSKQGWAGAANFLLAHVSHGVSRTPGVTFFLGPLRTRLSKGLGAGSAAPLGLVWVEPLAGVRGSLPLRVSPVDGVAALAAPPGPLPRTRSLEWLSES